MTTEPKTWEVRVSIVGEEGIFAMVTGDNPQDCFDRAMQIIERTCEECKFVHDKDCNDCIDCGKERSNFIRK